VAGRPSALSPPLPYLYTGRWRPLHPCRPRLRSKVCHGLDLSTLLVRTWSWLDPSRSIIPKSYSPKPQLRNCCRRIFPHCRPPLTHFALSHRCQLAFESVPERRWLQPWIANATSSISSVTEPSPSPHCVVQHTTLPTALPLLFFLRVQSDWSLAEAPPDRRRAHTLSEQASSPSTPSRTGEAIVSLHLRQPSSHHRARVPLTGALVQHHRWAGAVSLPHESVPRRVNTQQVRWPCVLCCHARGLPGSQPVKPWATHALCKQATMSCAG
jgi:hypothetical protein